MSKTVEQEHVQVGLSSVFFSGGATFRLLVSLVIACLSLCGTAYLLVAWSAHSLRGSNVTVAFSGTGGTQIKVGGSRYAVISVPASSLWVNSGIVIEPGERWKILASGEAHLAIHQLATAGEVHHWPRTPWVSPTGELPSNPKTCHLDKKRDLLLLVRDARYGQLVIALVPTGNDPPSFGHPRLLKDEWTIIRYEKDLDFTCKEESRVYCVVNDQYVDEKVNFVGTDDDYLDHTDSGHFRYRQVLHTLDYFADLQPEGKALAEQVMADTGWWIHHPTLADRAPLQAVFDLSSSDASGRVAALSALSREQKSALTQGMDSYVWSDVEHSSDSRGRMIFFADNVGSYLVQFQTTE